MHARPVAAGLAALALLAGCGGSSPAARTPAPAGPGSAAPGARVDAPAAPAARVNAPALRRRPLVYLSRNVETAVPEDVYVYADGSVRYRYLLHTKLSSRDRTTTLSPRSMRRLRAILARTRLDGAERRGADPPRGGYWYLLRIGGRSIATADGHLTAGVRPLIARLGRLEDRMLLRGEDPR
jgi:hypothetical protein